MELTFSRIYECLLRPVWDCRHVAVVLAGCGALMAVPANGQIFDFENSPSTNQVIPLPTLGDFDLGLRNFILNNQPVGMRAAKVVGEGLTDEQATAWFGAGGVNFDFVFADFEREIDGKSILELTQDLVGQVNSGATVGNFSFDPLFPDNTRRDPVWLADISRSAYQDSGVRMSNENLYPGSPSFKTNKTPNIRSGLFATPIVRFSGVEELRGSTTTVFGKEEDLFKTDDKHIPYVTRFNNFGNSELKTGLVTGPEPRADGIENIFDARDALIEGTDEPNPNANQLLSRGDFSAQVAHYRARGAVGVVLFQPGVIGYTKEQMREDAVDGWERFDAVYNAPGEAGIATLATQITVDGDAGTDIEDAGVVWSGVFSGDSSEDDFLRVLMSNVDEIAHSVTLDPVNGLGYDAVDFNDDPADPTFEIAAGQHLQARFGLKLDDDGVTPLGWKFHWVFPVFIDDDRSGIGVPEPASLVMLAIGSVLMGLPRSARRR